MKGQLHSTWQDLPGGFGLLGGHLYFISTEDLTLGTWEMVPVSYFTNGEQ